MLLWLRHRPEASALIQPLGWEVPQTAGGARGKGGGGGRKEGREREEERERKGGKEKEKKERKMRIIRPTFQSYCED